MKICACCKIEKDTTNFHKKKKSKDGLHNYCKVCTREKNQKWNLANREQHTQTCANWYKNNKEKANLRSMEFHYKKYYGISYSEFLSIVEKQNHKCKICDSNIHTEKNLSSNRAVLDHCHITTNIRAVLCNACNTGLGLFKDNIKSLEKAISYLKEYNENSSI